MTRVIGNTRFIVSTDIACQGKGVFGRYGSVRGGYGRVRGKYERVRGKYGRVRGKYGSVWEVWEC